MVVLVPPLRSSAHVLNEIKISRHQDVRDQTSHLKLRQSNKPPEPATCHDPSYLSSPTGKPSQCLKILWEN